MLNKYPQLRQELWARAPPPAQAQAPVLQPPAQPEALVAPQAPVPPPAVVAPQDPVTRKYIAVTTKRNLQQTLEEGGVRLDKATFMNATTKLATDMRDQACYDFGTQMATKFSGTTQVFKTDTLISGLASATTATAADFERLLNDVVTAALAQLHAKHPEEETLTRERTRGYFLDVLAASKELTTKKGDKLQMPDSQESGLTETGKSLLQLGLLLEVITSVPHWQNDLLGDLVTKINACPEFAAGVMNAALYEYTTYVLEVKGWKRRFPFTHGTAGAVMNTSAVVTPGTAGAGMSTAAGGTHSILQGTDGTSYILVDGNYRAIRQQGQVAQGQQAQFTPLPPLPNVPYQAHGQQMAPGGPFRSARSRGSDANGHQIMAPFSQCGGCGGIVGRGSKCGVICSRQSDYFGTPFHNLPQHPNTYDPNAIMGNGQHSIGFFPPSAANKYKGPVAVIMDPTRIKPEAVEGYIATVSRQIKAEDIGRVRTSLTGRAGPLLAIPAPPQGPPLVRHVQIHAAQGGQ